MTQLAGEGAGLRAGNTGLQQWQQIFHNNGFILAVLDELVKRLPGFLVHKQDEVIGFHGFDQFIDAQSFVIGLVAIEEHGEFVVGVATACGPAATFVDPTADLRRLDDDAK
jgi:hypothetical protein